MDLNNKTILITGGARVGQVVADVLGEAKANIVMTYRTSRDEIAQAVDHLMNIHGIRAAAYPVDMTNEASIKGLLTAVGKDFKRIDGLVNMASTFDKDPSPIAAHDVLKMLSVNAIGPMLLSRWFAELAKKRKQKNAPIVSFIDWAVDHPYEGHDLYLAAKASLRHYLMALQTSFAGTVRVVNIHPGMIKEPQGFPKKEKAEIVRNTPVKAIGDEQQAARTVRWAMENDFVATNVHLDGGQHWRHRL